MESILATSSLVLLVVLLYQKTKPSKKNLLRVVLLKSGDYGLDVWSSWRSEYGGGVYWKPVHKLFNLIPVRKTFKPPSEMAKFIKKNFKSYKLEH